MLVSGKEVRSMDKVIFKIKDVDALLAWRDNHPDLVRSLPMPLKALEFIFPESGWSFKAIREKESITFHPALHGKPVGKMKLRVCPGGKLAMVKRDNILKGEDVETVITVYCSTMALMVHGIGSRVVDNEVDSTADTTLTKKPTEARESVSSGKKGKDTRNSVTYILRATRDGVAAIPQGSHASPSREFSVRGHFRHYKSGKVVWVDEYRKGTDQKKKKSKRYQLGNEIEAAR